MFGIMVYDDAHEVSGHGCFVSFASGAANNLTSIIVVIIIK